MSSTKVVTVFWSWQLDSPAKENRNLIFGALQTAVKRVTKNHGVLIDIDRDTSGVGGSPSIIESILAKIRQCDIFVWDATLVHREPRWSPNANVLMEFGYALALLGDGRIIGVMNTGRSPGGEELPFDLKHRRWPIQYRYKIKIAHRIAKILGKRGENWGLALKEKQKKKLVSEFEVALTSALKESKRSAFKVETDAHVATAFWHVINSDWMSNWKSWRWSHMQYEQARDIKTIWKYLGLADRSEMQFEGERLQKSHDDLILALRSYGNAAATHMVPGVRESEMYVISAKANREWRITYDEEYEGQLNSIKAALVAVFESWDKYVVVLRSELPTLVTQVDQ